MHNARVRRFPVARKSKSGHNVITPTKSSEPKGYRDSGVVVPDFRFYGFRYGFGTAGKNYRSFGNFRYGFDPKNCDDFCPKNAPKISPKIGPKNRP